MSQAPTLETAITLAHWMRKHDVSMPQFSALLCVLAKENPTMTEIARAAHVSTAAVTAIVDKLAKLGWVRRNPMPGNRRTILVTMLAAGESALEEVFRSDPKLEKLHEEFSP